MFTENLGHPVVWKHGLYAAFSYGPFLVWFIPYNESAGSSTIHIYGRKHQHYTSSPTIALKDGRNALYLTETQYGGLVYDTTTYSEGTYMFSINGSSDWRTREILTCYSPNHGFFVHGNDIIVMDSAGHTTTFTGAFSPNTWQTFIFRFKSNIGELFVDGVSAGTCTFGSTYRVDYLGKNYTSYGMAGYYADVGFMNVELTDDEITSLINGVDEKTRFPQTFFSSKTIDYFKLQPDYEDPTTVTEITQLGDIYSVGSCFGDTNSLYENHVYSGTSGSLTTSSSYPITTEGTISLWFSRYTTITGTGEIIRFNGTSSQLITISGTTVYTPIGYATVDTMKWNHILIRWKGGVGDFFLNGVMVASAPLSSMYDGGTGIIGNQLAGMISDIALLNKWISNNDIYYIYTGHIFNMGGDAVTPPTSVGKGKLGEVATKKNDISYKRTLGNHPLETKYVTGTTAQQSFTATSDIKALGVWLTADNETTITVSIYTIGGSLVTQRDFGIVGNDREEFIFDFGNKINLITGNNYYFKLESEKAVDFGYDTDDQMLFSIYSEAGVFITGAAGTSLSDIATALYKWLDTARWQNHAQIHIDYSGTVISDGTSVASITWDGTEQTITLNDTYREMDITVINGPITIGTSSGYRTELDTHDTLRLKEDTDKLYITGSATSEISGTLWKKGLLA